MVQELRLLASFGRRRGRKPKATKQHLLDTVLPALAITLPEENTRLNISALFERKAPLWLEIGFGGGEHLAAQAKAHPEINFIGCEPYINGMGSLLAEIEQHKIANIRVFMDDARLLMATLPDASVEKLFILFPDPWPKTRHHKRRIINKKMVEICARILSQGGLLRLATDHEEYGSWMLERLLASNAFSWAARRCMDWQTPPEGWVTTRYQQKGLAGDRPLYLDFIRN